MLFLQLETPLRGYTSSVGYAATFPSRGRLSKFFLLLKLMTLPFQGIFLSVTIFLDCVNLEDVALFYIVKAFESDTALVALVYFLDCVLETL